MDYLSFTPEELLGPLNDVEQKNAPRTLYVAGDTGILSEGARVSIVGARKATAEGLRRASKLAASLARKGIVVVSGLAEGIDTAAHKAAIKNGGRTIAVVGTPLNQVYPKKNAALQTLIMEKHLAISQFPAGRRVYPGNFPMRNRTMALLADATVIIEASDSSGSLHQGWEALRLGRQLAIAKSITDDPAVTWPAKMMHYGAQILSDETLDDFLALLPERTSAHFDGGVPF